MEAVFVSSSLAALWLPAIAILSLATVAGRWVALEKMGMRRWAALVPVLSTWEVTRGASGSRALCSLAAAASAATLLSDLLGLGRHLETEWLASLVSVLWLVVSERLARAFGSGPGLAAGLVVLPIVAYPLLVSGGRVYLGPVDVPKP